MCPLGNIVDRVGDIAAIVVQLISSGIDAGSGVLHPIGERLHVANGSLDLVQCLVERDADLLHRLVVGVWIDTLGEIAVGDLLHYTLVLLGLPLDLFGPLLHLLAGGLRLRLCVLCGVDLVAERPSHRIERSMKRADLVGSLCFQINVEIALGHPIGLRRQPPESDDRVAPDGHTDQREADDGDQNQAENTRPDNAGLRAGDFGCLQVYQ